MSPNKMVQYKLTGDIQQGYTLEYPKGTRIISKIEELDYMTCGNIVKVILPEETEVINNRCFEEFERLREINLPQNLKSIKDGAFDHCRQLGNVKFGSNLRYIGANAFRKCENLREIVIPNSVAIIGNCAFESCSGLEHLELSESLAEIPIYAFSKCVNLRKVKLPESLLGIQDHAFSNCNSLSDINLPKELDYIEDSAFWACHSLETVQIPRNVTKLVNAFVLCTNLKEVEILNDTISLKNAFLDCYSLENINISLSMNVDCESLCGCSKISEIHVNRESLKNMNYPNSTYLSNESPVYIYDMEKCSAHSIQRKIQNSKGEYVPLYEIKDNQFKLHIVTDCDDISGIIDATAKFIYEPSYENFTAINGIENKMFLAVAFYDQDKRYESYVKKTIANILQYAGKAKDFELAAFIIDNNLIPKRSIDKCLVLIEKQEWHELFVMFAQYKNKSGGYKDDLNDRRFQL